MDRRMARALRGCPFLKGFLHLLALPSISNKKKLKKTIQEELPYSLIVMCENVEHLIHGRVYEAKMMKKLFVQSPQVALVVFNKIVLGLVIVLHYRTNELTDDIWAFSDRMFLQDMEMRPITSPRRLVLSPLSRLPPLYPASPSSSSSSSSPRFRKTPRTLFPKQTDPSLPHPKFKRRKRNIMADLEFEEEFYDEELEYIFSEGLKRRNAAAITMKDDDSSSVSSIDRLQQDFYNLLKNESFGDEDLSPSYTVTSHFKLDPNADKQPVLLKEVSAIPDDLFIEPTETEFETYTKKAQRPCMMQKRRQLEASTSIEPFSTKESSRKGKTQQDMFLEWANIPQSSPTRDDAHRAEQAFAITRRSKGTSLFSPLSPIRNVDGGPEKIITESIVEHRSHVDYHKENVYEQIPEVARELSEEQHPIVGAGSERGVGGEVDAVSLLETHRRFLQHRLMETSNQEVQTDIPAAKRKRKEKIPLKTRYQMIPDQKTKDNINNRAWKVVKFQKDKLLIRKEVDSDLDMIDYEEDIDKVWFTDDGHVDMTLVWGPHKKKKPKRHTKKRDSKREEDTIQIAAVDEPQTLEDVSELWEDFIQDLPEDCNPDCRMCVKSGTHINKVQWLPKLADTPKTLKEDVTELEFPKTLKYRRPPLVSGSVWQTHPDWFDKSHPQEGDLHDEYEDWMPVSDEEMNRIDRQMEGWIEQNREIIALYQRRRLSSLATDNQVLFTPQNIDQPAVHFVGEPLLAADSIQITDVPHVTERAPLVTSTPYSAAISDAQRFLSMMVTDVPHVTERAPLVTSTPYSAASSDAQRFLSMMQVMNTLSHGHSIEPTSAESTPFGTMAKSMNQRLLTYLSSLKISTISGEPLQLKIGESFPMTGLNTRFTLGPVSPRQENVTPFVAPLSPELQLPSTIVATAEVHAPPTETPTAFRKPELPILQGQEVITSIVEDPNQILPLPLVTEQPQVTAEEPPPVDRPKRKRKPRRLIESDDSPEVPRKRRPRKKPVKAQEVPQEIVADPRLDEIQMEAEAVPNVVELQDYDKLRVEQDTVYRKLENTKKILRGKMNEQSDCWRFSDFCEPGVCPRSKAASFFSSLLELVKNGYVELTETDSSGDPREIYIKGLPLLFLDNADEDSLT